MLVVEVSDSYKIDSNGRKVFRFILEEITIDIINNRLFEKIRINSG